MVLPRRVGAGRPSFALLGLGLCAFVLFTSSPAAAAGIVAKDGKIHACYKVKGRGKGTLRVVRSAKVKCPKRWKKTAWNANGTPGPQGERGAQGQAGPTGATGAQGAPGRNENVVVNELEDKVTELLTKVQSLEATLGLVCAQSSTLTSQLNAVESALGGISLNAVLTTIGGVLNVPTLPGSLPSFSCPS